MKNWFSIVSQIALIVSRLALIVSIRHEYSHFLGIEKYGTFKSFFGQKNGTTCGTKKNDFEYHFFIQRPHLAQMTIFTWNKTFSFFFKNYLKIKANCLQNLENSEKTKLSDFTSIWRHFWLLNQKIATILQNYRNFCKQIEIEQSIFGWKQTNFGRYVAGTSDQSQILLQFFLSKTAKNWWFYLRNTSILPSPHPYQQKRLFLFWVRRSLSFGHKVSWVVWIFCSKISIDFPLFLIEIKNLKKM